MERLSENGRIDSTITEQVGEISGGLEPSAADIAVTRQLKAAGVVMGIALLDHIIFNQTGYFSFLETGRL